MKQFWLLTVRMSRWGKPESEATYYHRVIDYSPAEFVIHNHEEPNGDKRVIVNQMRITESEYDQLRTRL